MAKPTGSSSRLVAYDVTRVAANQQKVAATICSAAAAARRGRRISTAARGAQREPPAGQHEPRAADAAASERLGAAGAAAGSNDSGSGSTWRRPCRHTHSTSITAGRLVTSQHSTHPPKTPHPTPTPPAAIARQIYVRQGLGVGQLRMKFGGRNKTRGVKPEHFKKASGGLIRNIIKQLEGVGFLEKHDGALRCGGGGAFRPAGLRGGV
jgi:hypothetical protein